MERASDKAMNEIEETPKQSRADSLVPDLSLCPVQRSPAIYGGTEAPSETYRDPI